MTKLPTKKLMKQWALEACEANGCPELAKSIKIEWSDRMTHSMGRAYIQRNLIRLSRDLFKAAPIEKHRNTVIHEVCHLITPHTTHGRPWQHAMSRAGAPALRCHNVKPAKSTKTVAAKCGCSTIMLSKIRANRIRTGKGWYSCTKCNQRVEIISE